MTKQSRRAQIPSHQWKRPSSALLDAPRHCSAAQTPCSSRAQIPSRGSQLQSRRKPQLAAASRARIPFWGSKLQPRRKPQLLAESLVQIPSWAGKRPRVLLDSRRPCSAAQLQSSSANLRIYNNLLGCSATQKTLSWCAKRARTRHSNSSSERDWANLGDGPAGLIAELVLAKDVADYVRFRAACRPWRRCSPDPRSQRCFGDSRYHPRDWIMLDKAAARSRYHRFLNLTTGECIRMDLLELEEHTLLALTPEGLILLLDEPTRALRLLNPLTRQLTDLPPVTALPTPERQLDRHLGKTLEVHGASIVDANTVVVSFKWPEVFVVAKPGDKSWTLVDNRSFESILPSAGRLYCATCSGVEVLNANTDDGGTPRLLTAIDWGKSLHMNAMMNDSLHLVDNAGDLMLVHRMMRWDTREDDYKRKWAVYKVDLDSGVLIPAKSFCGRAVFMGLYRTVSVSVDAFDIAADTLYFGYECGGDACTYNLGSAEATYYRDVIVEACDCDENDEH